MKGLIVMDQSLVQAPVVLEPTIQIETEITVTEFKDRLGANAMAIIISQHPVCVAFREMVFTRKTVDLTNPQIKAYLMMLVNNKQPEANEFFPGSGPLTEENVNKLISGQKEIY